MKDEDRIGARVAAVRKMRGLTGRQLAQRAHIILHALRAEAYGGVSALCHTLGHLDLRALALDRIEAADDTLAVTRADRVERAGHLTTLPPVRAGHYHIEIARARLHHGDRRHALGALNAARRLAPQQARYHPMVRETVQAIARTQARPSDDLRSFASWLGLQR